ncbi:MAG TPA: hypothetical protein VFR87_13760 [Nocardioidaceae bacterium]|nr:hypothetical protein [Nocardioidaceae bacterium]
MSRGQRARRAAAGAGWAVAAYGLLVRPWHLLWGATEDEARRPLPGDDLVPTPIVAATRAITIGCPSEQVWPWLVQQGYGRAGWYSYWVDNDLRPSPERVVPELQHLEVGDVLRTGRAGGFTVTELKEGLYWVGLIDDALGQISVVQYLAPLGEQRTRLIIRVRAHFAPRLPAWAFWLAFDAGDFVMMRKEMLGIRRRAERRC